MFVVGRCGCGGLTGTTAAVKGKEEEREDSCCCDGAEGYPGYLLG